jgi:Bacterial Ig-like domain (group 2)
LTVDQVLRLQRAIGNRATVVALQRLTVRTLGGGGMPPGMTAAMRAVSASSVKAETTTRSEVGVKSEARLGSAAGVRADAGVKSGSSVESGSSMETEVSARSASRVKSGSSVETEASARSASRVKSGSSVETEASARSASRVKSEARVESEAGVRSASRVKSEAVPGSAPRAVDYGTLQRDPAASVPVTGISLSAAKVSVPPEAGLSLRASAQPARATGVTFSVDKGSVAASGISIDSSTGAITLLAGQPGGTVTIKATSDDGSFATRDLRIVEKPTAVASSSASSQGGGVYGGQFTHTFTDASGTASGLEGENVNERFDSLSVRSPFGPFTLSANAAGSHGWDLDASGTMAGPDNVTIDRSGVDVGKFVASASNPSPAQSLPAGFTMVQHMRAKSFPSGALDATPFTDIDHVRTLTDKETFVVSAGTKNIEDPYTGPSTYTHAAAAPASIAASPPRPKATRGAPAPTWNRNTVQVTADVIPASGPKVFSIIGPKLGCEIDAASGQVLVGSTPGSIKVRISAGRGSNFDEVTISITP